MSEKSTPDQRIVQNRFTRDSASAILRLCHFHRGLWLLRLDSKPPANRYDTVALST
jgi:hypothetical protein